MNLSRWLISAGLLLVAAGVVIWLAGKIPGLRHLGRLPGDVRVENGRFAFYFPWVSCLVISGLFTLLAYLWEKFKG
jgi:hypothetical protein